jgi:hypothetical protein
VADGAPGLQLLDDGLRHRHTPDQLAQQVQQPELI